MKPCQSLLGLLCVALSSGCTVITRPWKHDCARYSPSHKECQFESKGTITFERRDGKVVAGLHPIGGKQSSSVYWPRTAIPYQGLDTNRTYTFEYLESTIVVGPSSRDWIDTVLIGVVDGNQILYDASICPLHKMVMSRQIEVGVSGVDYPDQYFDGERPRLSPNDGKSYLACGSGIRHMTWRCPTCYRVSEEWASSMESNNLTR